MSKLSIRMTVDTHAVLRRLAHETGSTTGQIATVAIGRYVAGVSWQV